MLNPPCARFVAGKVEGFKLSEETLVLDDSTLDFDARSELIGRCRPAAARRRHDHWLARRSAIGRQSAASHH